jgi:hypothetical protein
MNFCDVFWSEVYVEKPHHIDTLMFVPEGGP